MSGIDDPIPEVDWNAFRAARDRFLARVRPEAMDAPPPSTCPAEPPAEWHAENGPPASCPEPSDGE